MHECVSATLIDTTKRNFTRMQEGGAAGPQGTTNAADQFKKWATAQQQVGDNPDDEQPQINTPSSATNAKVCALSSRKHTCQPC